MPSFRKTIRGHFGMTIEVISEEEPSSCTKITLVDEVAPWTIFTPRQLRKFYNVIGKRLKQLERNGYDTHGKE